MTYLLLALFLAGCTIVHTRDVTVIAAAQAKVTLYPETLTCVDAGPECAEPQPSVVVDSSVASWWGTTFTSVMTAFFLAVQVMGWP